MPITRKVTTTTTKEIEEYDTGAKTTDIPTNANVTAPESNPARKIMTGSDLLEQEDSGNIHAISDTPIIGRTNADLLHEIITSPNYIITFIYILSIFGFMVVLKSFTYANLLHSIIVGTFISVIFFGNKLVRWLCVTAKWCKKRNDA